MYNAKYNQSNYEYRKKNLRRVTVDFTFSDFESMKASAAAAGLPVNTYIKKALAAFGAFDAGAAPAGDGSTVGGSGDSSGAG